MCHVESEMLGQGRRAIERILGASLLRALHFRNTPPHALRVRIGRPRIPPQFYLLRQNSEESSSVLAVTSRGGHHAFLDLLYWRRPYADRAALEWLQRAVEERRGRSASHSAMVCALEKEETRKTARRDVV